MCNHSSDTGTDLYAGEDPTRALFAGRILRVASAATALIDSVRSRLPVLFEVASVAALEFVHECYDSVQLYERTTRAQAGLRDDPEIRRATRRMLTPFDGPGAGELYFDGPRLRVVPHDGHRVTAAAPAYYVHRDTWFANSASQWNWWMPVFETPVARGFEIYPDCFHRAVPNDSQEFRLADWERAGGFQAGGGARQVHPRLDPAVAKAALGAPSKIGGAPGECVLFAAHHLHGTVANATGRTRFSLELRTVRRGDAMSGRGAAEMDNRSRGSTLRMMSRVRDGARWPA
ncbi:MAG: hypothetical protein RIF32_21725 [Leptospirales bacterium]|jgi:hypothetical protein